MPDKKTRLRDTLTVLVILTNFEARIIPCFELSSWEFLSCALPKKATAAPAGQCDAGGSPGLKRKRPHHVPALSAWSALRNKGNVFLPGKLLRARTGGAIDRQIFASGKDPLLDLRHTGGDADFRKACTSDKG